MSAVVAFFIILLAFEASPTGAEVYLYHKVGDNATLPCKGATPFSQHSVVAWLYNRDFSQTLYKVHNGNGYSQPPRESRQSLSSDLSLDIINITAKDAGRYCCRTGYSPDRDTLVYLSVLTISVEADPNRGDTVAVNCSLLTTFNNPACLENSLRWVDDTGAVLDQCKFEGRPKCSSILTVMPESGHSRTFTCQFVQAQHVKIQDHYKHVGKGLTDWSPLSFILLTLRIAALILMVGITAAVCRKIGNMKLLKCFMDHGYDEDDGSTVCYENV